MSQRILRFHEGNRAELLLTEKFIEDLCLMTQELLTVKILSY